MSLNLSLNFLEFKIEMAKAAKHGVYEFDEFRLDAAKLMLYRDRREIPLPPKVVETLLVLVEKRGEIVSKNDLMNEIWADSIVEESNLSQCLYRLRKILGLKADGAPYIETLRRRGYRFNGDVRLLETSPLKNDSAAKVSDVSHGNSQRRNPILTAADQHNVETSVNDEILSKNPANTSASFKPFSAGKLAIIAVVTAAFSLALFFYVRYNSPRLPEAPATNAKSELTILRLTNGNAPQDVTISPDGKYFTYHEQDGETARFFVQQIGQSNRLEIVQPALRQISGKTFSPDGVSIYFVAQDKGDELASLYRVPAIGGSPTRILTAVNSPVSFSPNGKEMVFGRLNPKSGESTIIIAASDGSAEKTLLRRTPAEGILTNPAWSPDGRSIAFCAVQQGSNVINAVDLQTGASSSLSPEKWDTCYRMAWTRDGQGLVFIGTKYADGMSTRRDQIYYLSIASGEARRLTFDSNRHHYLSLGVSKDDSIIAVPFNRSSQIWQMSPDGDARTAIQITDGQADGRAGLAPLTDGRVAYITRTGESLSIWLKTAGDENQKQLITDLPYIEELRAAPNGNFFVFSAERDKDSHLFRIDADGTNLRQLTFGDSRAGDSTVSPDGNWIVYSTAVFTNSSWKHSLWRLASAGGEPILLTNENCWSPHFSPDGKSLSCIRDGKEIAIISAETGATLKTFDTIPNPTLSTGARWTPDGRNLVYIIHRKKVGNLWLQPINGAESKPLTNFMNGSVYNFAFSPDGLRLYVARGNQIDDAILIKNFK